MKLYLRAGAALLALALSTPAFAQQTSPAAAIATTDATAPLVIAPPAGNVLPAGTKIRLRTLSELSSKSSKVGDHFDLEVAEDVLSNGRIVIARGTPAVGDVTRVKKKGMWGKSGKLEARVLTIRLYGRDIPVHGTVGDKGETGTAGVVASIAVLPVAGFFVTGTSAILPPGTGANAELESDVPFTFAD